MGARRLKCACLPDHGVPPGVSVPWGAGGGERLHQNRKESFRQGEKGAGKMVLTRCHVFENLLFSWFWGMFADCVTK
jgi:hypothetical protein